MSPYLNNSKAAWPYFCAPLPDLILANNYSNDDNLLVLIFGKYVLYTSVPEYLINPNENPKDLIRSFKNWITRFMYHNKSEEEYNTLKENCQLAVEVRCKIRKDCFFGYTKIFSYLSMQKSFF